MRIYIRFAYDYHYHWFAITIPLGFPPISYVTCVPYYTSAITVYSSFFFTLFCIGTPGPHSEVHGEFAFRQGSIFVLIFTIVA